MPWSVTTGSSSNEGRSWVDRSTTGTAAPLSRTTGDGMLGRVSLRVGAPADITVIDPNLEWTVTPEKFLSKSRNTPFAGMRLKGRAALTIVAGEIVYDGRKV